MLGAETGQWIERAEAARRAADPLALHDVTAEALAAGEDALRLRYLHVLALAQLCDAERAEDCYERFGLAQSGDEDALALRGRMFKDRAMAAAGAERRILFARASAAYLRAWELRHGYFPGINAASTAWAAGSREQARALAGKMLADPEIETPASFYAAATRAEALLLLDRADEAVPSLRETLPQGRVSPGERASAYRQLKWLSEEGIGGQEAAELLALLRPAPVMTFCGHMFRAGQQEEAALAAEIAAILDARGIEIGYGPLACGADLLIAEALLARGGELNVVLPFAEADFVPVSVLPGGAGWRRRFDRCLAAAASVTAASRMPFIGHDDQFTYGSLLAMGMARLRARQLGAEALQLAVWDGGPSRGDAGTAHDVAAWRLHAGESLVIPLPAIDRSLDRPHVPPYAGPPRGLRSVIFTDFAGFSRLEEIELPAFWRDVMGTIGTVLRGHGERLRCTNTWGDALFAIVADAPSAAAIALEIQDALRPVLGDGQGMRIGVHFGPMYEDRDPVTSLPAFYGSEVNLAARIEPRVPTGQTYVTQPFAAMLASTAPDDFACRYVGRIALAKDFGAMPMYQLLRG